MILILIFVASFAAVLAVYYMFDVPFMPGKAKWDTVVFNLLMAAALAFAFDRGAIVLGMFVLAAKLAYEKLKQELHKFEQKNSTKDSEKKTDDEKTI